jgi:predicted MFS family arabinose efflux permease
MENIRLKKRGWAGVASLALGSFASVTTEFLPVGLLPDVAGDYGITTGEAGLMMTLPGLLAAVAAPGVMMAAGKADRRWLLIGLSFLLLISASMSAWAPDWHIMLLSRGLTGISLGAFWAIGLAVAGRLVSQESAGKAIAAVFGGVTAAMILGVPFGTFVAGLFDWRTAFVAAALIAVVPLVLQLLFLSSVLAEDKLRPASLMNFIRRIEARKSILLILLIFGTHFGTYTFLTPLLSDAGIGPAAITLSLLGFGVTGFISNFVASAFVSEYLKSTLASALLVMMMSLLLMAAAHNAMWLIAGVLLWGCAWGALPLCLNINNRMASGELIEAGSAMFTFTVQVAIASGSAAGGVIVDNLSIQKDFFSGTAFIVFSLIILYGWKARTKAEYALNRRN